MKTIWLLLFFTAYNAENIFSFRINEIPICCLYTPDSILKHSENYVPFYIGNKKRYATCTGATWFHENYLAVLNLYGEKINTYKFHPEEMCFEALQEINNSQGAQLTKSENLVVSPDGSLLAVCSDGPRAGVKIYAINRNTHLVNPKPVFILKKDHLIHNARFTPDGNYLATTGWDNTTAISIYKVINNTDKVSLEPIFHQANTVDNLATKGINFTRDGRFAVIVYSIKAGGSKTNAQKGLISAYRFNPDNGSLGEFVCSTQTGQPEFCCEDVAFIDNDNVIIASDQHNSVLTLYPFNPISGQIGDDYTVIKGKEARLSFPHGIGLKSDGKYMAIANYGSDTCNVYQIKL